MNVLTEKNIKITFLVVLLIKLFVLMIGLLRELLFIQVKMQQFIKAILEEYKYCKKVMNKKFNKNLIMSEKKSIYFIKVTVVGFVKNLSIMMRKK